jgi:hypothetical protein
MTEKLTTKLPFGVTVAGGTQQEHDFLRRRGEFAIAYCAAKNWDAENLTIEQVLEIRSQPGWKTPGQEQA